MTFSDELAYLGVAEIALGIRRRLYSPVDVVDAFIARIEARNPRSQRVHLPRLR